MCLEKAKLVQQTEDIVCYKVLRGRKCSVTLYSPYQNAKYELGKKLKLRRTEPKIYARTEKGKTEANYIIHGGAYHSFIAKEQAKKWCKSMTCFDDADYVVVECIIPKTAKYIYKGMFGSGAKKENGYASSEIKPIKVIYQSIS